jgi:hypothetical protein
MVHMLRRLELYAADFDGFIDLVVTATAPSF